MKSILIAMLITLLCITNSGSSHAIDSISVNLAESESEAYIRLEKRLNNPYSVQNMQNAFDRYNFETEDSRFKKRYQ